MCIALQAGWIIDIRDAAERLTIDGVAQFTILG
jgi:hypothetical protein